MNGQTDRYLLDTNAVITLLRGNAFMLNLVAHAQWLGISVITQIEFLAFSQISTEDVGLFQQFSARVNVIDINHRNQHLLATAIRLRQHHRLKLPDAIIVASAITQQATLVTGDLKLIGLGKHIEELELHFLDPNRL